MVFLAGKYPHRSATDGIQPVGGAIKRVGDVILASIAVVLLSPLLVTAALLLAGTIGGPILLRVKCVGFGGRTIDCFRFRTLDANGALTAVGALLVQSGIDALPQLFNVIKGDMSCVGPPLNATPPFRGGIECLRARPGMAGMLQLDPVAAGSGLETLDSAYARDWSLKADIACLLKTVPALARNGRARQWLRWT